MTNESPDDSRRIRALKVTQWLDEWDNVQFDAKALRRKPDPSFFLFSMAASELKALSGIYRRTTEGVRRRAEDLGIQRRHDRRRSEEIAEFVKYGYPWSELSDRRRATGRFDDLRKPGWLPTAIVVNILGADDTRNGLNVSDSDLMNVEDLGESEVAISLPTGFDDTTWNPQSIYPIEVIDGQHRLWAFEERSLGEDFQLPVVAFQGLDLSWQAYLFWSINIKPKRINASLAFDLYPLLRTEDWLERSEGHPIYRETRAQELAEIMWSHPTSPWYQRINMLGEPGLKGKMVSQAAWIRSLMATYIKSFEGPRVSIGGLFGAPVGEDRMVVPWSRHQQAAFLIFAWKAFYDAVHTSDMPWSAEIRELPPQLEINGHYEYDAAFFGEHTLVNTDQGVRGFLYVTNDLCYARSEELCLVDWIVDDIGGAPDEELVSIALDSLREEPVSDLVTDISAGLVDYDWRTASAPGLSDDDRTAKLAFRGSGGYREIRRQLLLHLAGKAGVVGEAATSVTSILGFEHNAS